jgi:cell wall-associated NlpC family hydrolase
MIAKDWAAKISDDRNTLIGIPYTTLDCQAFVEFCLKKYAGISKNWRGSNDMWRNAVNDKSADFGNIEPGEWVFTIKNDGKQPARYKDGVNAAHVGVYIGNGEVIHSTTGGVQMDKITNTRWTHRAKANCLDYAKDVTTTENSFNALYNDLVALVNKYGGNKQ